MKNFKGLNKVKNKEQNMKNHRLENRKGERGNVLFLILIAVALFAALSYAVTSSSRSGGGDVNEEANLLSASTITQYPASVRTAMIRMQVTGRIQLEDMEFNDPDDFGNCLPSALTAELTRCVFHPDGGGATHVDAPSDVMVNESPGVWVYNGENEINGVGLTSGVGATPGVEDTPDAAAVELIAFLPGIKEGICEIINEELGIGTPANRIPTETGINFATQRVNADGTATGLPALVASATTATIGGTAGDQNLLDSQGFGCFVQDVAGTDTYVYYHALIEQ